MDLNDLKAHRILRSCLNLYISINISLFYLVGSSYLEFKTIYLKSRNHEIRKSYLELLLKLTDAHLATLAGKVVVGLNGKVNIPILHPNLMEILSEDFRIKHEITHRGGGVGGEFKMKAAENRQMNQISLNLTICLLYKAFFYLCSMNFSSKILESAVNEVSRLPGIGNKSALRLVLHILKQQPADVQRLSESLMKLKTDLRFCEKCHNISDSECCDICNSKKRDSDIICVVEDTRDVMAIENTNQYNGVYHVLGGLISPMDGIGPSQLQIESLLNRIKNEEVKEVILALSATMEGDTTIFYLYKKLKEFNIRITTIARGIAFGGELEYVDEVTLGRSITTRIPYERNIA